MLRYALNIVLRWAQLLASGSTCEAFVGLPWTKEFAHEAIHVEHPLHSASCASAEHSLRAVFNILVNGPTATVTKRSDFIQQLRKWKVELKPADDLINVGMNPEVLRIMRKKQLALIRKLIRDQVRRPRV